MLNQLKYYYYKAANTDWVRYIFYIVVVIVVLMLLYRIFKTPDYERLNAGKVYKIKESAQAVAIDSRCFYVISKDKIGIYGRKNGQKLLSKKLPFKHVKDGKIVNDDLVIVNSTGKHPKNSALIWLDKTTLEPIDMMVLPNMQGEIAWLDWAWEKWWLCSVEHGKNVAETMIYCFNSDWVLEGFWKLPKTIVDEIEPQSLTGGSWFGEYLCVCGGDKPELYILDLPEKKVHAQLLRKIQVCFDGHGFTFERGKGNVYAWGIQNKESLVVRCAIEMEQV